MAEIHLSAMDTSKGAAVPGPVRAELTDYPVQAGWLGGKTVKHLKLFIGNSTIDVWPADPDRIEQLADRLREIAGHLRGEATEEKH